MSDLPQKSQFLIYQAENGAIKIDVRFEEETVWLTQPLMSELFQTTQQNISLHLQNIYEEGELRPEATHKEFLSVRREGSRDVQRRVSFYNLDAIISVGYRVNSIRGTQFRIWATQRLREYRATRAGRARFGQPGRRPLMGRVSVRCLRRTPPYRGRACRRKAVCRGSRGGGQNAGDSQEETRLQTERRESMTRDALAPSSRRNVAAGQGPGSGRDCTQRPDGERLPDRWG